MKLNVTIYKKGDLNESILRMIANNNEGTTELSMKDIAGYVRAKRAEYPTLYGKCGAAICENTLAITEDANTWTLAIEAVEKLELEELQSINTEAVNQ